MPPSTAPLPSAPVLPAAAGPTGLNEINDCAIRVFRSLPGKPILMNCASSCLALSSGFARPLVSTFGRPSGPGPTHPAILDYPVDDGRIVQFLITKALAAKKPSLAAVSVAIDLAFARAAAQRATCVIMPRIACGNDGKDWLGPNGVRALVQAAAARHTPTISVVVCSPLASGNPLHPSVASSSTNQPANNPAPPATIVPPDDTALIRSLAPEQVRGCHVCARVEAAIALAPTLSAARLQTANLRQPNDARRTVLADAAVRLVRALRQVGWYNHQHREPVWKCEAESTPVPDEHIPYEARRQAHDIEQRLFAALDRTPQPTLKVRTRHVTVDDVGDIMLPLPPELPPELEQSYTTTDLEDGPNIWRQLVVELASYWAELPGELPLSLGRVFLGPKGRLIYWPRLINRLLGHIPISYDQVADLVRALTMMGFKIDLKSAYRSLRISRQHARYYGACVDGTYVIFTRGPFGSACTPAHFTLYLRETLFAVRGTSPRFDDVLAGFVDDLGGGAGDGGRMLSRPTAAVNLMGLADRLTRALIADGWWQSLPKTFLRPSDPMYYTGLLAHFTEGMVGVEPGKAAKLRALISGIALPDVSVFSRNSPAPSSQTGDSRVAPQIRTACYVTAVVPLAVAAWPVDPTEWPVAPHSVVIARGLPSQDLPRQWSSCRRLVDSTDTLAATIFLLNALPEQKDMALRPAVGVVVLPSVLHAHDLTSSIPPGACTHRVAVVFLYPRSDEVADRDLPWFHPTLALPAGFPYVKRPLPALTDRPPVLPTNAYPTTSLSWRSDGDLDMTAQEFASLRTLAGYISWISSVVPHVAAWRTPLDRAWRTGTWSRHAVAALTFLWHIAAWLPGWTRNVRAQPCRILHVKVDTARASWGALMGGNPPVALVGTIPFHARAASTLTREAWGGVGAIQAAIRRTIAFDSVEITNDAASLVSSAGTPSVPTDDAGEPMRALAALDYQGIPVAWRWERRSEGGQPIVDAISTAAGVRVWPLLPYVASALLDMTPGGWQADGLGEEGRSWTGNYLTGQLPEKLRERLFHVTATQAAQSPTGWLGDIRSWTPGIPSRTLFVHGLWSELPLVASMARRGCVMVVIAPVEGQGQWWQPALEEIRSRSGAVLRLPSRATQHPDRLNPVPDHADARRLGAFFVGISPASSVSRAGRPAWWTPYRLTSAGDIEANPGPGPLITTADYSRFGRSPPSEQRPQGPRRGRERLHRLDQPVFRARRSKPPMAEMGCMQRVSPKITLQHIPGATPHGARDGREAPSAAFSSVIAIAPPAAVASFAVDLPPRSRTGAEQHSQVRSVITDTVDQALRPVGSKRALPGPSDRRHAPDGAARHAIVARQAASGSVATTAIHTIRQWLGLLLRYIRGRSAGAVDPDLHPALHTFVAVAQATTRLKSVLGSGSRSMKAIRYLWTLADAIGVLAAPFTPANVDGLAVCFAIRRLESKPPFGWKRCTKARSPASDLSSVAATSGRAGCPVPAYCGRISSQYLNARGAAARPEHSDAWPIHLYELQQSEPPDDGDGGEWITWAALMILSLFCLRPGVLPYLCIPMFVAWDGGYILVFRYEFKSNKGDVMDPELRAATPRVTGARHPALHRIFQRRYPCARFLRTATSAVLSAWVRRHVPSAPKGYTIRPYGIRVAADIAASALGVPDDLIDAIFWWRRLVQSMRLYYGALSIRRMYLFSEARARLKCVHLTVSRYDAKLEGPVPDFSPISLLNADQPALPDPNVAAFDAAWVNEGGAVLSSDRYRKAQRVTLGPGVWAPLPDRLSSDDSEGPDDVGSTASLDCDTCATHLDRTAKGTMCEESCCARVRCTGCQSYGAVWWCNSHRRDPPAKRRR